MSSSQLLVGNRGVRGTPVVGAITRRMSALGRVGGTAMIGLGVSMAFAGQGKS